MGDAMFRSARSRVRVLALMAMMAMMVGVAVVGLAGTAVAAGNNTNAQLCQKNGRQRLETSIGDLFANRGACVSYGAHGGQIFGPEVTLSSTSVGGETFFTVTATGFHASSTVTIRTSTDPPGIGQWLLSPDGSVTTFWSFLLFCPMPVTFTATDSFGVHAAATGFIQGPCP